jgi:hypothetical protein
MGLAAVFLSLFALISTIFSILGILGLPAEGPLFSDKLTWYFWIYLAGVLLLGAIVCLLSRKQSSID